jgi:hypothetical protein
MPSKEEILKAIEEAKAVMKKNGECSKIKQQIRRLEAIANAK